MHNGIKIQILENDAAPLFVVQLCAIQMPWVQITLVSKVKSVLFQSFLYAKLVSSLKNQFQQRFA